MKKFKKGGFIVKNNNKGIPMFGPGGFLPKPTASDSLAVMNAAIAVQKYYDNLRKKGWYKEPKVTRGVGDYFNPTNLNEIEKESLSTYTDHFNKPSFYMISTKSVYPKVTENDIKKKAKQSILDIKNKKPNTYIYKDLAPTEIDEWAPPTLIDMRIKPQTITRYVIKKDNYMVPGGGYTDIMGYDPIVVKPAAMKTASDWAYMQKNYGVKPPAKVNPKPPVRQTVNTTQGKVTGVVRPNQIKGSQLVMMMNPVRSKENLKKLEIVTRPLTIPKVVPQGKLLPITPMQLPQQGNIPFYGPGNTIIGYTDDNRNFYPAQKYTGSPNNQLNLQDKQLLENPELLQQYVLKRDNYKFAKGGVIVNSGGEKHRIYVKTTERGEGTKGHIMVNHPTMDKGMWDTIDLTERAGAKTIAQGVAATKKWHKENPYMKQKGGSVNLNLPVFRMPEKKPFVFNKFLVNDKNQNLFIGGINPTYQNEKLSVGPYMVGVGNKYFQKFPADYGVRGNYNVNDNFNINMSVGKNNINAGVNYKFRNGGKFLPIYRPGGKNDVVTPNNLEQLTSEYNIIQEQINKGDENKNAYLKNMRKIADDLIEKQFALEKSNVLPESILNWRGPNGEPSSYCIGTSCYLADLAGDKFYPENSSFFTSNSAAQDYAKNNPNATRYLEQDEKYIESGDILQFKSGKKGSPFHAFTVYDIGKPNKENYRPLTVVGSQGHGPIIKKTYFLGDDNKVYTDFEGFIGPIHDTQLLKRRNNNADYNSIIKKRNKLKEQIIKLDPGYFIPKEDIRYNDYKQTIFSLNKDKLQANNERKGLQYVDTKNSKLEEIVNKYNDPNYKYNYMREHNISSNEYDLAVSNMLGIYGAETKFGTDYTTKGKLPESPKLTKIANALGIIDQEKHSIGPFQITYNQLPESYRKTIKPKDLYNPMIGAEATMENIVEGLSLLRKRANTTKETATENNPLSQNINKQNYLEYLPYLHNMRKWLRGDNYTQEKYNSVLKGDSGYKQLVDDYRNNLLQISRTPLTTPEPLLIKNQKQEGGLFKDSIGEWDYPRQSNIMSSKKEEIYSYKKGGQHGGLDRWFAEKWVDIKTGKTCGRQEGEDRNYPACRPSKRISFATPKTASELSSAEKERFKREKTSSKKISYQHNRK